MRAIQVLAIACSLLMTGGCETIINLTEGPHVYGGVRNAFHQGDMESSVIAMFDLPFSFVLDTALLPVTALCELLRWMTGWPPPSSRLYPPDDKGRYHSYPV